MYNQTNNNIQNITAWLSITLFYCYQYIVRILPNIIEPNLTDKYGVDVSAFADFASIYYLGYVAVHIPIGIAFTKFGAKKTLPIFIALTALGLYPLVYCDCWYQVIWGRIINGVGSSAAIVGALQVFRTIYPRNFSQVLGLTVCASILTAVFISAPLSQVIHNIGFDNTVKIIMYSGLLLAIVSYFIIPEASHLEVNSNIFNSMKTVLLNYKIIILSLCAGLMVGTLEGFGDAWGSKFLLGVYAIPKADADKIILSIFIGMCAGCIILPYIAEKFNKHICITILSGIAIILSFVYILSQNAVPEILYYACFASGLFSAYQVVILPKIITYVPEKISGFAASIANMIIMAFGMYFHKAIAALLDFKWDGLKMGQYKVYNADAYVWAISVIPASILVAIIGLLVILAIDNMQPAQK